MRLYVVTNRRPLAPVDRKVYVYRYVTIAETLHEAIEKVKSDQGTVRGQWTGRALDYDPAEGIYDVFGVDCYTVEPTTEEREQRTRLQKEVARG